MKIIIIGAGELGRLLAAHFSAARHDVTLIDSSPHGVDDLHDKLDVMTLHGSATDVRLMQEAGIARTDVFLAVSGDEASNVLACQIARHFGVGQVICRLYSTELFDESAGLTQESYGLGRTFSSPAECATKVLDVLPRRMILDDARLSHPEAGITTICIEEESPLAGQKIMELPWREIMENIRFAALVRGQHLMIPHGQTKLQEGDKLYVAGRRRDIQAFLECISPKTLTRHSLVVISGATRLGKLIADGALEQGREVRLIEPSEEKGEAILAQLPASCKVIVGSATDEDILREAGIEKCDTFIGAEENDEGNILGCILAKRLGAGKVVAVTHKPEYISIVPAMEVIDCGFNTTLVSANAVFHLMNAGNFRMDSRLLASQAYLTEFALKPTSRLNGKRIMDCQLPPELILALLFRGTDILTPAGRTVLQAGDVLAAVVTPSLEAKVQALFG